MTSHQGEPVATGGRVSGLRVGILLSIAVGLWGSFAWWSVLQERLLTRPYAMTKIIGEDGKTIISEKPEKFHFPFFLNVVAYLTCVALALVLFGIQRAMHLGTPLVRVDLPLCFSMSTTLALGTPFGYAAARYIAYPIVLTAKMCKPIPTMIVGFVWYKQRYLVLKYVGVLLLTFGVLGFSLFDEGTAARKGSGATSLFGLGLCGINLMFDGYTQSSQDAIIQQSKAGSLQMMMLANGLSAVVASSLLFLGEVLPAAGLSHIPIVGDIVIPSEFTSATEFLNKHPQSMNDLVNMALLGAVGQVFIFVGIGYFGTLTIMGLTVSRKIGSVLLSIWLHDHDMNSLQQLCLGLVVVGILLDAFVSVKEKSKRHHGGHHAHAHGQHGTEEEHEHDVTATEQQHAEHEHVEVKNDSTQTAGANVRNTKTDNVDPSMKHRHSRKKK